MLVATVGANHTAMHAMHLSGIVLNPGLRQMRSESRMGTWKHPTGLEIVVALWKIYMETPKLGLL